MYHIIDEIPDNAIQYLQYVGIAKDSSDTAWHSDARSGQKKVRYGRQEKKTPNIISKSYGRGATRME